MTPNAAAQLPSRIRAACDYLAAAAMAAAMIIVAVVAILRNVAGFTPIWTEPVVGLLVFVSVCAAIPAGLRDGVHVSMHILDRMGEKVLHVRDIIGQALSVLLGLAVFVSAAIYAEDMFAIDLTDYAGIPDGLPALVGALFGLILAVVSLAKFRDILRRTDAAR